MIEKGNHLRMTLYIAIQSQELRGYVDARVNLTVASGTLYHSLFTWSSTRGVPTLNGN